MSVTDYHLERIAAALEKLVIILAEREPNAEQPAHRVQPRFDLMPPKGRTDRAA